MVEIEKSLELFDNSQVPVFGVIGPVGVLVVAVVEQVYKSGKSLAIHESRESSFVICLEQDHVMLRLVVLNVLVHH